MEILLLVFQVRDFRINGNNRFGELEKIGQRVDELVVTNSHITTSTCFEPAIAVSTKKDGSTRCMVECIALYHGLQRSTEQRTSRTVVTDYIVSKIHFRTPFQVFDTETFAFINHRIQWIHECNLEFLGTIYRFLVKWNNVFHLILGIEYFHGIRADELYLVALSTPIETIGLRMHVSANHSLVIQSLYNLQVSTVYIDSIVHHTFVQTVTRNDFTLTSREMGSIGLCSEVSWIILTTEAYIEFLQSNVFTDLSQQAHTFGIVDRDVFQTGILVHVHEDARCRTFVVTHSHLGTWHQTCILPMR